MPSAAPASVAPRCWTPSGAGQHPHDLLTHPLGVDLHVGQDARGHALGLPRETQKDVLGADVVVPQRQGFPQSQFEHLLRPGREGDLSL